MNGPTRRVGNPILPIVRYFRIIYIHSLKSRQNSDTVVYVHTRDSPPPPMAQQPLVDQGLLMVEASRSHADTPHSVGLLWTSDQPDEETSTYTTHNTHNRQTSMYPAGFEPTIPVSERPQTHALDLRQCEVRGSHSGFPYDSNVLGCYALSIDK
jgi:hypothetical protein